MNNSVIVDQLSTLISEANRQLIWDPEYECYVPQRGEEADPLRVMTRLHAAVDRLAPPRSVYRNRAAGINSEGLLADLISVVEALRDDYAAGAMIAYEEIVHAGVFDDFLDMAAELTGKGFHGPAAVLAGSVLEEHLRKVADKSGIALTDDRDRPKSVETLSVELVKQAVINEPRRKIIAGWYGQRTQAAHGNFDAVIPEETPPHDRRDSRLRSYPRGVARRVGHPYEARSVPRLPATARVDRARLQGIPSKSRPALRTPSRTAR